MLGIRNLIKWLLKTCPDVWDGRNNNLSNERKNNLILWILKVLTSKQWNHILGAAYGLAGIVKGLGIISFKQLDIMTTLTEAIQDKKNFK